MKRHPLFVLGRIILVPWIRFLFFIKLNGKKNVPKDGAYIICSNHLSNFDPVFLGVTQRRQIFYMAKAELFRNKFFAGLIRKLGAFPVQRGAGDGKAINEAEDIVKSGKLLGIFIEGTRSKTGEFLRPKSGAAIVASQMKVPVIPVCITPKNRKKKVRVFSRVIVSWGEPITPEELGVVEGSVESYRKGAKKIMDEIKALRARDLGLEEEK